MPRRSVAAAREVATACHLCGAPALPLFAARDYEHGVPGEWRLARCSACALVFLDPLPAAAEIGGFYPPDYSAYNSDTIISWMSRVVYAQDAKRIAALTGRSGRILDVGCGNGAALLALKKRGSWELHGVEIDAAAAERARKLGLPVQTGELTDCTFPEASFDLIRMGHVIEHARDPLAILRRAYALLKTGGVLFGETPNTDCLDFRLFGRYWGALHVPRHIVLFDDANLRRALAESGFRDVRMSWRLRTVGWSAGIQNFLADRCGLKVPPSGRVRWYALLIAPFLPVTLLQAAVHKTATVAFTAGKPAG